MNNRDQTGIYVKPLEGVSPVVTVCCATYNHEAFIREALDGFLAQRLDAPMEVVVFDDCSTDATRDILRDYQRMHPDKIHLVLPETNLRSQGVTWMQTLLPTARGTYIALCEGDDRWTASDKLQVQLEYLEARPECAGCFHRTRLIDERGDTIQQDFFVADRDSYDFGACLSFLGKQYATCSMMIRAEAVRTPAPWLERRFVDMLLELQVTRHGDLGYIDRNMADYRRHGEGVWSRLDVRSQILEIIHRYRLLLEDRETRDRHGIDIDKRMNEFVEMLVLRSDSEASSAGRNSLWKVPGSWLRGRFLDLSRRFRES